MKEFIKQLLKLSPIPLSKNHLYDLQTKKILLKVLNSNSNCIDVGCFKGEILDLMKAAAPDGNHFGVEPVPEQYQNLAEKYKNIANCTILNYALSNEKGRTTFNHVLSNPSYSGLLKREYDKPNETDEKIEVETERLDNLIPKDLAIDLIKIDVEGAEMLVLEGAEQLISKYKPVVVFEHGLGAADLYQTKPSDVFQYFHSKGMNISTLSSFLKNKKAFTQKEFDKQFFNKINYYFVAFPKG